MNRVFQDPAYGCLKERLIQLTGLAFYANRDELLTEVIDDRLSDLGLSGCSSYASLLGDAGNSAEMDLLIGRLTIGETYFFRDPEQFAAIRDIVLPDILERNRRSKELRIWSAGCASGAEPYSLAILLAREMGDRIADWQIRIFASDLDRNHLAQAAEGKFGAWALRTASDKLKSECFSQEGESWTIQPRYRQWISFHQINLVGSQLATPLTASQVTPSEGTVRPLTVDPRAGHAQFDLILCRNVMIYFARDVRRRLISQFHQFLGDGGWLVVGGAEHNIENYKAFRTVRTANTLLYQKVAGTWEGREAPPQPFLSLSATAPKASDRPSGLLVQPPPVPTAPLLNEVAGLRQLVDRGDWRRAAEHGQALLTRNKLVPEVHFYRALIFENLGIAEESKRSLRHALYLDRNFALAHYHLGLALRREREIRGARRSFENVLRALDTMPEDAIVTAGSGISVIALKELARTQMAVAGGSSTPASVGDVGA